MFKGDLKLPGFVTRVNSRVFSRKLSENSLEEVVFLSTYMMPSKNDFKCFVQSEVRGYLGSIFEKRHLGLPLSFLDRALGNFPEYVLEPFLNGDLSVFEPVLEGFESGYRGKVLDVKYMMVPSRYVEDIEYRVLESGSNNVFRDVMLNVSDREVKLGFEVCLPLDKQGFYLKGSLSEVNDGGDISVANDLVSILNEGLFVNGGVGLLEDGLHTFMEDSFVSCLKFLYESLEKGLVDCNFGVEKEEERIEEGMRFYN